MKCQEDKEEYEYLLSKGFHLEWFDDMSGWWFSNYCETDLFGDVEITISDFNGEGWITCSTLDKTDGKYAGIFDFIRYEYTRENLKRIINILTD